MTAEEAVSTKLDPVGSEEDAASANMSITEDSEPYSPVLDQMGLVEQKKKEAVIETGKLRYHNYILMALSCLSIRSILS
jgi:hypothetical protein